MREIEFRIWDKILQGWSGNTQHFSHCRSYKTLTVIPDQGDRYIFEQYIGIKDKNGTKIFEGDVIEDNVGRPWVVFYDNKHTSFKFKYAKNLNQMVGFIRFNKYQLPFTIIGNIHENKDLIEP